MTNTYRLWHGGEVVVRLKHMRRQVKRCLEECSRLQNTINYTPICWLLIKYTTYNTPTLIRCQPVNTAMLCLLYYTNNQPLAATRLSQLSAGIPRKFYFSAHPNRPKNEEWALIAWPKLPKAKQLWHPIWPTVACRPHTTNLVVVTARPFLFSITRKFCIWSRTPL